MPCGCLKKTPAQQAQIAADAQARREASEIRQLFEQTVKDVARANAAEKLAARVK